MTTPLGLRQTGLATADRRASDTTALYEVIGLPFGREVFIRCTQGKWKVLHVKNGVRQSWSEGYETLEDAFATVRVQYDQAPRSRT